MDDPTDTPVSANGEYLHGHAEPVLRSHRWRTAENSAAHLLGRLRPGDHLLDVGCGPGTITVDLARHVPGGRVVGVDRSREVLDAAREAVDSVTLAGAEVEFRRGDVARLPFDDDEFDVVHAHQVLQHLTDPVGALREMARVCRPGGTVAVRDSDYGAFTWSPEHPGLDLWLAAYRRAARSLGAEPDAGRHLLGWCQEAALSQLEPSASAWCFATPADRRWWGGLWADRVTGSDLTERLLATGCTRNELAQMAGAWRDWTTDPAGWFAVLHGEVLVTVG